MPRFLLAFAAGLLAGAAHATVSTVDYDRLAVLPATSTATTSRDWRANGAVTPVKNEGTCDASWAFGVTGLVEGYRAVNSGTLVSLSEQELIDCNGAGSGCSGGSPIAGLRTTIARGGLATSVSYPFTAVEGSCKASIPVSTIPGAGLVPPGDEVSLKAYVDQGPVMALVAASPDFDAYSGGTFTGNCGSNPTRAVLIVGYGTNADGDFWIVKNSRGVSWGSSGYIFMARGTNLCGIANHAVAVSDDPLPSAIVPAKPVPSLNAWATLLLALGFAGAALVALRRRAA